MLDRFFEWIFPPEDPEKTGRKMYVVGPRGRLVWVPDRTVDPRAHSSIMRWIHETYPGGKVRLAYDEPIHKFIALKLREWFGYEWKP